MKKFLLICVVLFWSMIIFASSYAFEKPKEDIVLGMSTALSGPAANLGKAMQTGVLAAIQEINNKGGIHGRMVKLITLDDGYEPTRTTQNINKLINEYNVACIIGDVGTPTAVAAIPITNKNKIPFYGAYTGAGILRKNPPDHYIINYRASYAQETAEMVKQLLNKGKIKPEEIGFFTQRDTYGNAGFQGALKTLKQYDPDIESKIVHARYERNTVAVEKALADIILHEPVPKAVIMVGAYEPCAEFIRIARENNFNPVFLNVSFVGADPLAKTLGENGDGVIITQVVPYYHGTDLKIVEEYQTALKNTKAKPTFGSLEGYIAARILFKALTETKEYINRETIIEALEGLGEFDIGLGEKLTVNKQIHQACNRVWPSVIKNGKVIPFNWDEISNDYKTKNRYK